MTVTLMQNSSLEVCEHAIKRSCQSYDKSNNDTDEDKNDSTFEHLTYTFFIEGISNILLQELISNKIDGPTIYPLDELKEEYSFSSMDTLRASKYLVMIQNKLVDEMSIKALENLRIVLQTNIENDIAQYCLPQSYKTSLTWTINARSLQNFIALTSSESSLWEIRKLAKALFKSLPKDHKYFFENYIAEQE